jgi:hypothetical protein
LNFYSRQLGAAPFGFEKGVGLDLPPKLKPVIRHAGDAQKSFKRFALGSTIPVDHACLA